MTGGLLPLALCGLAGAGAAHWAGLPMPFLLGSLAGAGSWTVYVGARLGRIVTFPVQLRWVFIAVIGVLIGATFSTELMGTLPALWPALVAMMAFVLLTHGLGYAVFRHLGRYDRTTALFAAMLGGLIEAVELGERAGGDVRILTVQHFARIVMVVTAVPMIFFLWSGETVGSAGGQSFDRGAWAAADLVLVAALAAGGLALGRALRLPAWHLMGALILSASAHGIGLVDIQAPDWLLGLAQFVVGLGLGAQFSGLTGRMLARTVGCGAVAVAVMLSAGAGFALVLAGFLPLGFPALFISFAPGGVTEMSLVALSLGVNPVAVAALHLFRIVFTVAVAARLVTRLVRQADGAR